MCADPESCRPRNFQGSPCRCVCVSCASTCYVVVHMMSVRRLFWLEIRKARVVSNACSVRCMEVQSEATTPHRLAVLVDGRPSKRLRQKTPCPGGKDASQAPRSEAPDEPAALSSMLTPAERKGVWNAYAYWWKRKTGWAQLPARAKRSVASRYNLRTVDQARRAEIMREFGEEYPERHDIQMFVRNAGERRGSEIRPQGATRQSSIFDLAGNVG